MAAEQGSVNEIAARFCPFQGLPGRLRKGRDSEDSRGHAAVSVGGDALGCWCYAERVRAGAIAAGPRAQPSSSRACTSTRGERAGSGVCSGRACCSSCRSAGSGSRTGRRSPSRRAGRSGRAAATRRRQGT
jgi:hypothetical protein